MNVDSHALYVAAHMSLFNRCEASNIIIIYVHTRVVRKEKPNKHMITRNLTNMLADAFLGTMRAHMLNEHTHAQARFVRRLCARLHNKYIS